MSKIFRFDCYPHDWLLDTSRLTPEDRGVYVQIVMLIYARGSQIDNDPKWISGSCTCSPRLVAASILRLVHMDFIQLSDGIITQRRADRELKAKRAQIENGVNGGRKSAELRPESLENKDLPPRVETSDPPSSNPTPTPIPKSEKEPPVPLVVDRHRLVFDLPDEWLKIAVEEMGWSEIIVRDVWTNFGRHYRHAVGPKGFGTDGEWLALWRTWYRKENIKPNPKSMTAAEPAVELTEEQKDQQRKWHRKMGIQHPTHNPEGIREACP
jgi:uncharacterized protein YdaU (DUF1376 family)